MTTASVKTGRSHLTGLPIAYYSTPVEEASGANDESAAGEAATEDSASTFMGRRSSNVSGLGAFAGIGAAGLCLAFRPR